MRCLDEEAKLYDGLSFKTSPEGLAELEKRIFKDGANPMIVFEATGLDWLMVALYLKGQHPDCRLVRVQAQKVVALRNYLHRYSKSDKIDAITLAKMPFVDPEKLEEIYFPPAKLYAIQRLARQRQRLEREIAGRKVRLIALIDGYLPGVRQTFSDPWSVHARAFYRSRLSPLVVVRAGEKRLQAFLDKARRHLKEDPIVECHLVYRACQNAAALYRSSSSVGMIDQDFFADLQDEISRELRLMEMEEAEAETIAKRLEQLYRELHPSNNLRTIPGIGRHTAPIFLAIVGDPSRFHSQSSFANYCGVVPGAKESADTEVKGLNMTKAGPAIMKWALFQAGQIGRHYDPQMAWLYYREMVHNGKNHMQAMGAIMSHLSARVLAVLREDKPYELRDIDGRLVTWQEARNIILAKYQVPESVRRERRHHHKLTVNSGSPRKRREMLAPGINEAATAPQPVGV